MGHQVQSTKVIKFNGHRDILSFVVNDGDSCAPGVNPCKNNATCNDGTFEAICNCTGGWSGPTCEGKDENSPN